MAAALLILLLLLPSSADATAGFAERHSELLYGELAFLDWIHPGDGCDCGSFCFQLMKREPRGAGFRGMQRSLGKVSAPAESTPPWLMAQACSDRHWIVYDLAAEEVLADTESYESALAVWRSQGLADPSFADAQDGARGLHQSWRSHAEDVALLLMMFLPMLVLLSFPVCTIASLWLFARYARTRRNRDRIWALVVLVPTLPGWWLAWRLFSSTTGARVGENQRQAAREYWMVLNDNEHGRATDPEQLAHLDRAVQLDPTAVNYRETRAGYLASVGRVREAKADLDRAIELADRPYLRFSRAGVQCALGSYQAAAADLDLAIAAQPENTQFYPSRAVARAALGRIDEARADAETAIAQAPNHVDGYYARAIVLLAEGRPAEALAELAPIAAQRPELEYLHLARARAHAALSQTELAAAARAAAERADQSGALCLAAAAAPQRDGAAPESTATASAAPVAPAEAAAASNPSARLQVFGIEESTSTRATVDIEHDGTAPGAESPLTLQLLDGRGVRLAKRIAVRNACSRPSGDPKESEVCHVVTDYAYSGPELEKFALAFGASVAIRPRPLDRTPLTREAQLALLARVFDAGFSNVDGYYAAGWQRSASGDWIEQSYWSELDAAGAPPTLEPTGTRFAECSLAAFGAVTEIACPKQRTLYLDNRYLGTSDELELGPAVRYAAEIDGVRAYVVIRALNSVTSALIVFHSGNEWHLHEVLVHHGGC